jgi:ubiquinone/menaquinone biosynthesis C-methylase UbiE
MLDRRKTALRQRMKMGKTTAQGLYAQFYDVQVPDWPGEVDFYTGTVARSPLKDKGVLEVACGTGRITLRLAKEGVNITGLDLSPDLLDVALRKSAGLSNIQWVQGDMQTFEIGTLFGCVIMPGHSFQFMNTPDEQVKCLERIKHHLVEGGLLIIHLDHQDFGWLAGLIKQEGLVYEKGRILTHPATQQKFRYSYAWSFEPSTQTATIRSSWEEMDEIGKVIQVYEMEPKRLHCIFRFEMEHLLKRTGFSIESVYGDFFKNELCDTSSEMIWVARNREN